MATKSNKAVINSYLENHNVGLNQAIYLIASIYTEHPGVVYRNILHRAREFNKVIDTNSYTWITRGKRRFTVLKRKNKKRLGK